MYIFCDYVYLLCIISSSCIIFCVSSSVYHLLCIISSFCVPSHPLIHIMYIFCDYVHLLSYVKVSHQPSPSNLFPSSQMHVIAC